MARGDKKAADRRVVLDITAFDAQELLALLKLGDAKSKAMVEARAALRAGVYRIDVTVRVAGDIEVGIAEKVQDKVSTEKHLVAALSMLSPGQRKKVLSKNPGGSRSGKIMAAAELKAWKSKLPKHYGPAKLTPHLLVTRVGVLGVEGVESSASGQVQTAALGG